MPNQESTKGIETLFACAECKDTGYVWLGSQPYGFVGESYAPCHCAKGAEWAQEHARSQERMIQPLRERCPVCGGLNPGDITHARC